MKVKTAKNIYFAGIGGIGCSSLAQILKKRQKNVAGSDLKTSKTIESLEANGIKVNLTQEAQNITADIDLLIYSPAVPESNPERLEAKKLNIRTLSYPEALGEFSEEFTTIAIAGTHGKSTTTAMTALAIAEISPTVVIGTKMSEFDGENYRVGESDYLLIEACEYKKSFANFTPQILAITNIELDHIDYYSNIAEYKKAFIELAKRIPEDGHLIILKGNDHLKDIAQHAHCNIIEVVPEKLALSVPGQFNQENANIAVQIADTLGVAPENSRQRVGEFSGTWRRMERRKTSLAPVFIDDYAHHPTEVKVTLQAIRQENPDAKILCIFQPHQYSRTLHFLQQFAQSFADADQVIIPNIYKVRDNEADIAKINAEKVAAEINAVSKNAQPTNGIAGAAEYLRDNHQDFDIVITMGAGDIDSIYDQL